MLSKHSDINKALKNIGDATQDEKQVVIDKFIALEFADMKAKRCTHEFSTPHIAREALTIMLKDSKTFSNLVMMKKANKLNAELKNVISKATGKPLMEWVPLNQKTEELAA